MRKTLLAVLLLLSATWLLAQDSMGNMGKSSSTTTIQGCLSNSKGQYWLTESNGTVASAFQQCPKAQRPYRP